MTCLTSKLLMLLTCVSAAAVPASSITGSVKLNGVSPKLKKIKMVVDPECVKLNGSKDVFPDRVVVNKQGQIQNVFVYLKEGFPKKTFSAPKDPVELDQRGCMFSPHVLGVVVGQTVRIKNTDTTFHNIHSMPQINPQFNFGLTDKGKSSDKVYLKPEMGVKIGCDVHKWMGAWLHVMEHPYFGVSDEKGMFTVKDVPPGTYTVSAWHEELGTKDAKLTVVQGKDVAVYFEFNGDFGGESK